MKLLWEEGDMSAKNIAIKLEKTIDWSKTTTYTVIKRMVEKGLIERSGTNYFCRLLLSEEDAKNNEIKILADKMFDGSTDLLLCSLLGANKMKPSQIETLRTIVKEFFDAPSTGEKVV